MSLTSADRVEAAVQLLRSLDVMRLLREASRAISTRTQGQLESCTAAHFSLSVGVRGLEAKPPATNTTVLWVPMTDPRLEAFCLHLRQAFQDAGFILPENRPLKLHATIINTIYARNNTERRAGGRAQIPRFDARSLIHDMSEHVWADNVALDRVAICRMGAQLKLQEKTTRVAAWEKGESLKGLAYRVMRQALRLAAVTAGGNNAHAPHIFQSFTLSDLSALSSVRQINLNLLICLIILARCFEPPKSIPSMRLLVCLALSLVLVYCSSTPADLLRVPGKATDENLTSENWALILDVCDKVGAEDTGGRDAAAAMIKRLAHRNANVQLYTLELANALSQNCGPKINKELASRSFTDALLRLAGDRNTHTQVKAKILERVAEWAEMFSKDPDLGIMEQAYMRLKSQNPNLQPPSKPYKQEITDMDRQKEDDELQMALALSVKDKNSSSSVAPEGESTAAGATQTQPTQQSMPTGTTAATVSRVRALYDFQPSEPGELQFFRGDIVAVLESVYKDWWKGSLRGQTDGGGGVWRDQECGEASRPPEYKLQRRKRQG
ncbi:hypothetical protein FH972_023289 [Carpinus fangiana]|uniref:SH3 domain-containing protein n=1 Tax=Carpinus fangiana TaxID=176857 RepID=A0A5N6KV31_9ROSI|nr:hypothetical protein FH972_023289 [Carpinus fangiana]